MKFRRAVYLIAILLAPAFSLFGEESPEISRPEITATRINPHAPNIDGDLSDPIWKNHDFDLAQDFLQMQPDEGDAATESTLVAIAYDDEALYIAFWCYDNEPDKIIRRLVRRDRGSDSDAVVVRIDPYHDHQSGYKFDLYSAGVLVDSKLYNDTHSDRSWDAIWEGATKAQPWGWSAEYKIPFSCIRFSEGDDQTWGLSVSRYIARKQESDWWAFSPSTEGGMVSTFGHLNGLKGIQPARHLEILPFAVTNLNTEPKHSGNTDGRDFLGNMGVDAKYALSSDLILDATINPDFGQVELDRPVLNLSSFETFYEEKRPFFLEGANLFNTPFDLFYSRRIGRPPQGEPDEDFLYYTDRPKATTILGAGKITGKLDSKTSLAILTAFTQEERADYSIENVRFVQQNNTIDTLTDILAKEAVVEPFANYTVLRVQRDILKSSSVGFMGTLASQDKYHPATTGGLDWRLYTNDGVWGMRGQVVTSKIADEQAGFGFDGMFEKVAGKHFKGAFGIEIYDPHLNLNRLGYLRRNNWREGWLWTQYRTQDDWFVIRNTWTNFNSWTAWNYDGDQLSRGWNINSNIEFLNGWNLGGGVNQNIEVWDDRETRDNGLWNRPSSWSWWASLDSDNRKSVWFNINPGSGENRYGSWWANYIGIGIRPRSNIELNIGTNFTRGFGQTIWVDNLTDTITGELVSVFADLNQDEITPRITANINLTRDLSFQFSGRMLISALDYRNHRGYAGNETYFGLRDDHFEKDLSDSERDQWGDGNYRAFNSTMVIRWEYRPGSTLYVVWTQAREGSASPNNIEFDRDLRGLFSSESSADNVFLIKASYWLNI